MRWARLLVSLCLILCTAAAARAETAGQILFAYGETHALRAGRIVRLVTGAPVESGDQLHTGAESYLQIRFTDWGVISLRPRTDFVVEEYAYEPRPGGRERAFFALLNGGIRSLTGMIGHRARGNYRLRTRDATIGIRGTQYSVLMCRQDCRDVDGLLGADGLYGGVTEGRIAVSPYGGAALEREFGAGEYFRLDNENVIPVPLFAPPSFFWDRHEPQAGVRGRTFAGVPWQPEPGAILGSGNSGGTSAGGELGGLAGSLLRTDGSLTLSPITAPVLSQIATPLVSTVNGVVSPIASLAGGSVSGLAPAVAPLAAMAGTTVGGLLSPVTAPVAPVGAALGSALSPVVAPVAPVLGSTAGAVVNPVLAPVAPLVGSTVGTVANPVVAPVAPVIGSTVAPIASPVVAPVAPVIAPVTVPVIAPVAPVIAPVAPVIAPVTPVVPVVAPIAPVITPPVSTVTLPTVPSLPVSGGLPSLLPKK